MLSQSLMAEMVAMPPFLQFKHNFKIDGNGEVSENFCQKKRGIKAKWKVCLEMRGCHYHIGFFLEIPYDADMEKNFDVR